MGLTLFRNRLNSSTTIALTPLGKEVAEKAEGFTKKAEILSHLEEGPATVSEIANETHMSTGVVINNIKEMLKSGKVRTVKGDM